MLTPEECCDLWTSLRREQIRADFFGVWTQLDETRTVAERECLAALRQVLRLCRTPEVPPDFKRPLQLIEKVTLAALNIAEHPLSIDLSASHEQLEAATESMTLAAGLVEVAFARWRLSELPDFAKIASEVDAEVRRTPAIAEFIPRAML